jgi:hypothetical protein
MPSMLLTHERSAKDAAGGRRQRCRMVDLPRYATVGVRPIDRSPTPNSSTTANLRTCLPAWPASLTRELPVAAATRWSPSWAWRPPRPWPGRGQSPRSPNGPPTHPSRSGPHSASATTLPATAASRPRPPSAEPWRAWTPTPWPAPSAPGWPTRNDNGSVADPPPEAAEFLITRKQAHYLFVVKANQPILLERCTGLPWHRVPTGDRTRPARLAGLLRGHWAIEALHHLRDVTFGEDASQVRTGAAPHVMAVLRNLAVGALSRAGPVNLATALRRHARNPRRPSPPSGSTSVEPTSRQNDGALGLNLTPECGRGPRPRRPGRRAATPSPCRGTRSPPRRTRGCRSTAPASRRSTSPHCARRRARGPNR